MGAEVQQDVQVLELAGRALEDQVSEGGHAQVGSALQGAQGPTSVGCTYQSIPQTPKSMTGVLAGPSTHLILAVLADHLQGTLRD